MIRRSIKPSHLNAAGFTFIEVLLAILLILLLAMPLLRWTESSNRYSIDNFEQISADLKLQSFSEGLRKGMYSDLQHTLRQGSEYIEVEDGDYLVRLTLSAIQILPAATGVIFEEYTISLIRQDQWGQEQIAQLTIAISGRP